MKQTRLMSPVNYLIESLLGGTAVAELQPGARVGYEVGCKSAWFVSSNDGTSICGIAGVQSDHF